VENGVLLRNLHLRSLLDRLSSYHASGISGPSGSSLGSGHAPAAIDPAHGRRSVAMRLDFNCHAAAKPAVKESSAVAIGSNMKCIPV